jgi:hypothetical protein
MQVVAVVQVGVLVAQVELVEAVTVELHPLMEQMELLILVAVAVVVVVLKLLVTVVQELL